MLSVHDLPAVNASLNALSGVLLLCGYALIRPHRIDLHRKVMIAAFATSSLFLICYVVYHAQVGSVPFPRQGFVRPLYFTILITHVTLAATVPRAGDHHADARAEGALPAAPPHRALDLPDLAVRLGDRRAGLRAALPADLAHLVQCSTASARSHASRASVWTRVPVMRNATIASWGVLSILISRRWRPRVARHEDHPRITPISRIRRRPAPAAKRPNRLRGERHERKQPVHRCRVAFKLLVFIPFVSQLARLRRAAGRQGSADPLQKLGFLMRAIRVIRG